MYCVKCGREIQDDAVFCSTCGRKVKESFLVAATQSEKNTPEQTILEQSDPKPNISVQSVPESAIAEQSTAQSDLFDLSISESSELEQDSNEKGISWLLAELDKLDNAIAIYKYMSEKTDADEELLQELMTIREIERMYGNKKQNAITKVKDYYSTGRTIIHKQTDTTGEESVSGHALPPNPNEKADILWYYLTGNERKGPISEQEIADLARRGMVRRDTMVWKEGFSGWIRAEDTALRSIFQSVVPPMPTKAVSDKWLWALATIPILVNIILSALTPGISTFVLMLVTFVANTIFLTLDTNELKQSGYTPESWLWLGILLVPVYLFVRAAKTTRNVAPGIVWCGLLFISFFV